MKRQAIAITVLVAVAVAGSVFIGAKAILGTASGLRAAPSEVAGPGPIESTGTEVAALAAEMSDPEVAAHNSSARTDPTVPYTPPPKPQPEPTKPATSAPRRQSYTVTAVILDEAPTAIIKSGSETVVVGVGDRLGDGIVTAIRADGVTVTSDNGEVKYGYSASR